MTFGMPDEARDGQNVALNYQVIYWCDRTSKGTILLDDVDYDVATPANSDKKMT